MSGTETNSLPMVLILLMIFGVLLLMSVTLVWIWYYEREKYRGEKILGNITMLVRVPKDTERSEIEEAAPMKDFKELMSVAEQFFSSLSSLHEKKFKAKMLGQEVITFEIISHEGEIGFYITCNRDHQTYLEKQVHSFYPNAQVDIIEPVNIFSGEKGEIAAGALKLNKRFIYPIVTYRDLENDPLNAITNTLSKLGEGSSAAIQVQISPSNDWWRNHAAMAAYDVSQGKSHTASMSPAAKATYKVFEGVGSAISGLSGGQAEAKQQEREKKSERLTPQQEEMMKMFNEKGSKLGFKTIIRVVATAGDKKMAQANRDGILAAFSQYNSPEANGFTPVDKIKQSVLITDFMMKYFDHAPIMLMNTEELASIFHFPNRNIETPNIAWLYSKSLPPPVDLPEEGVIIGKSVYRGEEKMVRMTEDDRRRHLFMLGKTGVGKTTFFEKMIDQDIRSGAGLCFIDPLGDAVESILMKIPKERADDVIYFDPSDIMYPMGLNLLEFHTPEERDFLVQECIEMFYKLFDPNRTGMVGPQFEHWFRNAALTVMSDPQGGTIIEIPRLFTDDEFRKKKVEMVTDPVVKAFWEEQMAKTADFHKSEMFNYFISKFGRFMTNDLMRNIIGQKSSAFNLREVMDSGKILLINLAKGKIGEINSNLLGLVMVSKIQIAAFSRADIPEETRKDFYLYIDEFQNFTTDTFATILSEARKYHLSLNITNQFIAQLTEKIRDAVIGNAGTIVTYRIGAADAEFLQKELPNVTITDMANLDRFHLYAKLLINLRPSKPFSMIGLKSDILPDVEVGEATRQLSRLKYARDKIEVERDILGSDLSPKTDVAAGANEPISKL